MADTSTPPERIRIAQEIGTRDIWDVVGAYSERVMSMGYTNSTPYVREDLTGWRDIESAPKDGTRVLVFSPLDKAIFACGFENGMWQTGVWRANNNAGQPTHWMPLPTPPEAKP